MSSANQTISPNALKTLVVAKRKGNGVGWGRGMGLDRVGNGVGRGGWGRTRSGTGSDRTGNGVGWGEWGRIGGTVSDRGEWDLVMMPLRGD